MIALAELVIQGVKDGLHQALELFPKLLSAISSKKTIRYQKGDFTQTMEFLIALLFNIIRGKKIIILVIQTISFKLIFKSNESTFLSPSLSSVSFTFDCPSFPFTEDGRTGEVCGPTETNHLLNSLCGCRWDPGCVQHIAHMCQEVPMDDEELRFLVEKILRYHNFLFIIFISEL